MIIDILCLSRERFLVYYGTTNIGRMFIFVYTLIFIHCVDD